MDRPKSVVRVIWGVVLTVHVSHLFIGSSSGMYGIRYLRVCDHVSVSLFKFEPVCTQTYEQNFFASRQGNILLHLTVKTSEG